MKDYPVNKHTLEAFFHDLQKELEGGQTLIVTTKQAGTGKWGMQRLWRSWMSSVADYMVSKGATMPLVITKDGRHFGQRPFNADDAHELFTYKFLGADEQGRRLSWAKADRDGMRAATKGERFHAMQQLEVWAVEKGITLFKPRDSEYFEMESEQ